MRLSYKGWFVFSQPLRLLVALSGFVVAAIGTAPWRATVRLGIDTLIANILVGFVKFKHFRGYSANERTHAIGRLYRNISLSVCLSVCLSDCLSAYVLGNAAK